MAACVQTYRDIVEKYPGSDAWRMAYQLVNGEPPKELPRVAPPVDSLLAAAGRDSAAADSTPRRAELASSPDLPPTPLPTLTSGTAAADSAARAAFPVVPGRRSRHASRSARRSRGGGRDRGGAFRRPPRPAIPRRRSNRPRSPPPRGQPGGRARAGRAGASDAHHGSSRLHIRRTGGPDAAIAAVVPAPNGVPANAITPGTPQRMRSRVVRQEVAAAAPRAWAPTGSAGSVAGQPPRDARAPLAEPRRVRRRARPRSSRRTRRQNRAEGADRVSRGAAIFCEAEITEQVETQPGFYRLVCRVPGHFPDPSRGSSCICA